MQLKVIIAFPLISRNSAQGINFHTKNEFIKELDKNIPPSLYFWKTLPL